MIDAMEKTIAGVLTAAGVRVKPLRWLEARSGIFSRLLYVNACIVPARKKGRYTLGMAAEYSDHPSIEAAKAAAQADYETRIMAALEIEK